MKLIRKKNVRIWKKLNTNFHNRIISVIVVICTLFENPLVETEEKGELEAGRARLDKLQAKSSSVYLCLTWEDPILAAFYLIEQADALAFDEPIFKVVANIT